MRRVILMRHAKSDWSAGMQDHERPLNKRGKTSAHALGQWLQTRNYIPDQVLCSSAERTGQTLLGLGLAATIQVDFSRQLYLAEADMIYAALRDVEVECVLMIGHNPGIADLAHQLISDPPEHPRFLDYPTGATLVLDFANQRDDEVSWHNGQLVDFIVPRDLR